jgi:hypothetical protein
MFGFVKKGELKNRLRRRTADKLYDLERSAGSVPTRLPAAEASTPVREGARLPARGSTKGGRSRIPTG